MTRIAGKPGIICRVVRALLLLVGVFAVAIFILLLVLIHFSLVQVRQGQR